jgi:transglutaminase-like putative cysteine protease
MEQRTQGIGKYTYGTVRTHLLRYPLLLASLTGLLLTFLAVACAHAETVVVAGTMVTHADMADHLAIDIPAGLTTLTVEVPLPQSADVFGYEQDPGDVALVSSRTPDKDITERDSFGNNYRALTFNRPAEGELDITVTQSDAEIRADLNRPSPDSPYPIRDCPSDVAQFLNASTLVQSDDESIRQIARSITIGAGDEATAAKRISAWMSENMNYAIAVRGVMPSDASWALSHHEGSCDGWAHAFLALARAAGIPARFAAGFALGGSLRYPADEDGDATVTMRGHNQSHAWVELWFPKTGWVPYEPQGSAAFADSHHMRTWVGLDCDTAKPFLRWQGYSRSDVTYQETVEVTHMSDQPNLTYVSRAEAPAGVILLSRRQTAQD